MNERSEAQERERRRIWTVAVRMVDGALRARVIGQLQASGETELAAEAGWNAADVSVTDDAALGQTLERATVLLTDDISLAHAALAAGVAAVLPTDVSRGVLVAAIAAAARGLSVLEPGLLSRVVHESAWPFHEKGSTVQPSLELTAREREVLTLLAEGASNKLIGRRLGISVHTVKYHVSSILEKLDATGRTDAVAHAARLGLILL
jgi:DNA-binding NarL/FixJ family response regulator